MRAPPHAAAVGQDRHAPQQLQTLRGDPPRAPQSGADPDALEMRKIILQLCLYEPSEPLAPTHHRHADQTSNGSQVAHLPSPRIRHGLLSACAKGILRAKSFREYIFIKTIVYTMIVCYNTINHATSSGFSSSKHSQERMLTYIRQKKHEFDKVL